MRPLTRAYCAAVIGAAFLIGAGTVAASPPDDDGSAAALEQFVEFAADEGHEVIDPACSASPESGSDHTFTCYAMTAEGGPLIARTTLSAADVVEFEILAQPGRALDPAAPQGAPVGGDEATTSFDPLAYFSALFSGDPAEVSALQSITAPGSPAEAYALFQLAFAQTIAASGGEVERSYVYLTPEGVLVCVTQATCVSATDLTVVDGQLVDFAVDGNEIAPRLGRPGPPMTVGPTTARVSAAYRAVTGNDALRVFVDLSSISDAIFELSNAVYVDAEGTLTPVDRDTSIGAVDGAARDPVTVALDFPSADPGGEVRFLVFPRGAAAPLPVLLPVESAAEPPPEV
jgi:hypothetical protein